MSNGENRTNGPQFRTAPLITSAVAAGAAAWQDGPQSQSSPVISANG